MPNTIPHSGYSKNCWRCAQSFTVRHGNAEAIIGHDDRLYCSRTGCEEAALMPLAEQLQRASVIQRAA